MFYGGLIFCLACIRNYIRVGNALFYRLTIRESF